MARLHQLRLGGTSFALLAAWTISKSAPNSLCLGGMVDTRPTAVGPVRLSAVFRPECIRVFEGRPTKRAVIEALLTSLVDSERIPRGEMTTLADALMARERLGTTALGKGGALPHLRTKNVSGVLGAIGLIPQGADFNSLDGAPTQFVFLVLAQFEERERHLEVMGRLSALMQDKTAQFFLRAGPSPAGVHQFLADMETVFT